MMTSRKTIWLVPFAVLLILLAAAIYPSAIVNAKKTKPAPHGALRIKSNPDGLPVEVDGKSHGTTTVEYSTIDRLEPGVHTVVVTLPDGRRWRREIDVPAGRVKCLAVSYRAPIVIATSPCPYPLKLDAPSQIADGSVITYVADVNYPGSKNLVYTWTVTPGSARILSGAGTPKLELDTTGLAGQRITATLIVDDGSGGVGCRQMVQASTYVPPLQKQDRVAGEFDTCCGCANDDQKARLDNLAIELQNDPSATTYVIAYAGRNSRKGRINQMMKLAREYLTSDRGIDNSRIVVLDGGTREQDCIELWLVPQGAKPPVPRP